MLQLWKKEHFKSECRAKSKGQVRDQIDYRNIQFLETEQPEVKSESQPIQHLVI